MAHISQNHHRIADWTFEDFEFASTFISFFLYDTSIWRDKLGCHIPWHNCCASQLLRIWIKLVHGVAITARKNVISIEPFRTINQDTMGKMGKLIQIVRKSRRRPSIRFYLSQVVLVWPVFEFQLWPRNVNLVPPPLSHCIPHTCAIYIVISILLLHSLWPQHPVSCSDLNPSTCLLVPIIDSKKTFYWIERLWLIHSLLYFLIKYKIGVYSSM